MLFTEKLSELEGGKGKYIGEAKDGFQKQDKKNNTRTKCGSEDGGGGRNTETKAEVETRARRTRQKAEYW